MIPLGMKGFILLEIFWTGSEASILMNDKAETFNLKMLNETSNQSLMNGSTVFVFNND